jgi:hypothetical protein
MVTYSFNGKPQALPTDLACAFGSPLNENDQDTNSSAKWAQSKVPTWSRISFDRLYRAHRIQKTSVTSEYNGPDYPAECPTV